MVGMMKSLSLLLKSRRRGFNCSALLNSFIAGYYFENSISVCPQDNIINQSHSFSSDSSNCSFGSVVYLRRLLNGIATVSIVFGRSKVMWKCSIHFSALGENFGL